MSLGFQLHAELRLPLEKQDLFFYCRLLLCVSGREVTLRDLSRVLHLPPRDARNETAPQHPEGLCPPRTSHPGFEMDSPPLSLLQTLRAEQGLPRSVWVKQSITTPGAKDQV